MAEDVAEALRSRPPARLMSDEEAEAGGPFEPVYQEGLDKPAYVILVEQLQLAFDEYQKKPSETAAQTVNNLIYRLRTYDGFFH